MTPEDPRHGENRGYAQHLVDNETPCDPCRLAHNLAVMRWSKTRKLGRARSLPAIGVQRRVQALRWLGWTQGEIAAACGWKGSRNVSMLFECDRVQVKTWQRVAKAYEEMSMTIPPPNPIRTKVRNIARRNGWAPPLAWDEGSIDDPNARPHVPRCRDTERPRNLIDEAVVQRVLDGERLPTSRAEKAEIVRRWVEAGGSVASICRRNGWHDGRYVERQEAS